MFEPEKAANLRCLSVLRHAFVSDLSVGGGELFDRIIDENYTLMELDAVVFIRQICEGLQHMHKMYILHLDLKVKSSSFIVHVAFKRILYSLELCFLFCISARKHSVCEQSHKQGQNHRLWTRQDVSESIYLMFIDGRHHIRACLYEFQFNSSL